MFAKAAVYKQQDETCAGDKEHANDFSGQPAAGLPVTHREQYAPQKKEKGNRRARTQKLRLCFMVRQKKKTEDKAGNGEKRVQEKKRVPGEEGN